MIIRCTNAHFSSTPLLLYSVCYRAFIFNTMSKIKLLKVDELSDGTQRFQSQLLVGKDTTDFVMGTDGIMKCYGNGDKGGDFYPYNQSYEIVSDKSDMVRQAL